MIGGHNVVDGADGNDQIDAGSGHDVVTGDNAVILRETRVTDTRWRALSGTELLSVTGNGVLTGAAQADPTARQKRSITLLNHTSLTSALVFGNDSIAGGSGDDQIFGQLGNDA
ncbi:MAG: hypothetical protein ACK58T_07190, partial [Phycisphaerae bacterium]